MAAVEFAVITPLPEEWHAVKAHLEDVEEPPSTFPTVVGRIGRYRVVVRMAPETGEATTADVTRQVVTEWNPAWVALVGVAGGFLEKDVGLGDVVIASKIYAYDVGKIHADGDGVASFFGRRDKLDIDVDRSWTSFAKLLADPASQRKSNWTKRIKVSKRPDRGQRRQSKLHVGPIASGDKVVDDPSYEFFAESRKSLPDLLAIEMEGAGAGTAVRNLQAERRIGLLMIRGISDLPRSKETQGEQPRGTAQRDSWKPYAAAAAAAFFAFLLSQPSAPPPPSDHSHHIEWSPDSPPIPSRGHTRGGLPSQPTSFVGRQQDVNAVTDALRSPSTRLLTLIGTAGVGKTRLAVQAATKVEDDFTDGIVFTDLSSLIDPYLVTSLIAQSLGLLEDDSQSIEHLIQEHLLDQSLLLILDNFEHLIPAATSISSLLKACPNIKVLATSRRPLHISWEHEFLVDPMANSEAVILFQERAKARRTDFVITEENRHTISRICELLDGIPLAIELAASHTKTLSPSAILERLRRRLDILIDGPADVSPRHASLRAAMDWSHDLLSAEEQAIFRRLSVIPSTFSTDTALYVGTLGAVLDLGEPQALRTIESLVDGSLIQRSLDTWTTRLVMLQSVREYAREQLIAADEVTRSILHLAMHMADVVEIGAAEADNISTATFYYYLDIERENLRAAIAAVIENEQIALLLRLVKGLWRYWLGKGYLSEWRALIDSILGFEEQIDSSDWHEFLAAAASFARDQGDDNRAVSLLEKCLEVAPSQQARAETLRNLGLVQLNRGDRISGEATLRKALELHMDIGRLELAAYDLISLGVAAADALDYRQSLNHLAEAERLLRLAIAADANPDPLMRSALLNAKARAWHGAKNIVAAAALYELGLFIDRAVGHKQGIAYALQGLAQTAFDLGRKEEATTLLEISLNMWSELGDWRRVEAALDDRTRFEKLGSEAIHRKRAERWLVNVVDGVVTMPEAHSIAIWAEALAQLVASRLPVVAAQLLGVALDIRENGDASAPDEVRPFRDRLARQIGAAFSDSATFERLLTAGRSLDAHGLEELARTIATEY